jgi:hypothetical protein
VVAARLLAVGELDPATRVHVGDARFGELYKALVAIGEAATGKDVFVPVDL